MIRWHAPACLFLIVASPSLAYAQKGQPPNTAASNGNGNATVEAAQHKKEGDDAFRSLKYADALRAYDASFKLVPNPALHFNRGRSLEALERYPEAVDAFEAFLQQASPELRSKAGSVAEHMAELRAKVASVALSVTPEAARARVLVRNVVIGTSPLRAPLRVNAGSATVEVAADGFMPYEHDHVLPGGVTTTLSVVLVPRTADARPEAAGSSPAAAAAAAAAKNDESAATRSEKSTSVFSRWWFWTGAGVVLAGAATAIVVLSTRSPEPRTGDIGRLNAPLLRF